MGFGFNLLAAFVLAPLLAVLLLAWALTRKKIYGLIFGLIIGGVMGLVLLTSAMKWMTSKKELEKDDYYGEYIIDRSCFPGKQADWQYNNFRFEIKSNDSIYFYKTDQQKILYTYRGKIATTTQYRSKRLIVIMDEPTHHIFSENPTTYRSRRSFYLVFHSPKFYNVFFKKGRWQAAE